MLGFFLRVSINLLALVVAGSVMHGIRMESFRMGLMAACILGIVNAVIRPAVLLLTLPINVLTLGLFTLVINAGMLLLASWIAGLVGLGFTVDGFWPAFWGGLVISVVSIVLSMIAHEGREHDHLRRIDVHR